MLNKAVLAFEKRNFRKVAYGKWLSRDGKLYFDWILIAEIKNNEVVCFEKNLTECRCEYSIFHTTRKVIKYLDQQ